MAMAADRISGVAMKTAPQAVLRNRPRWIQFTAGKKWEAKIWSREPNCEARLCSLWMPRTQNMERRVGFENSGVPGWQFRSTNSK